jgi:hypothetical protein
LEPILIFDKSFLQSLNIDEAVLLDNFFICNICPLFYVETLADIEKMVGKGRPPERIVSEIASKFPEMHGMPNAFHLDLCLSNLMGYPVPLTGQIVIRQGRPVKMEGKSGIVVEETPEAQAFSRWQNGEFLELERSLARDWRLALKSLNLQNSLQLLKSIDIDLTNCKNLDTIKLRAEEFFSSAQKKEQQLNLAFILLGIPDYLRSEISLRWHKRGDVSLKNYAPYAAYVLIVEIFFLMAMQVGLISSSRASNKIDISYLFYLPFSMVFVSSDRLHRRCVPLFLRDDQSFVWGPDLKNDLANLNRHYSQLPQSTKERGLHFFASYPPQDDNFLIKRIWDKHLRLSDTPSKHKDELIKSDPQRDSQKTAEELRKIADSPSLKPCQIDFDITNPNSMVIKRKVSIKKGNWFQLPKDTKEKERTGVS